MKLIDLGPGDNDCPCGCGKPARMWTIEGFDGYVDAARDCAQTAMIDVIAEHDRKPCRVTVLHEQGVFDDDRIADAELTDIAEGCARCIADAPTPQQ